MRLLFITQKLHTQDAFGVLWIREFIRQGFAVTVLCLEASDDQFEFPVHSLGKEKGASKLSSILRFEYLISSLSYDRVFIHMAPIWYALGFWLWILKRVPAYLWYTHYQKQIGVWLFGLFGRRFFCATPQSLPQYQNSPKKIVTGHGIDLTKWPMCVNESHNPFSLLMVHRLSRSKRVELSLQALTLLDPRYTIDIYGIEAEKDYVQELHQLVDDLSLRSRVRFHGTVPMEKLSGLYIQHRLVLNMASETIDKTMLEAMTCGCYPVTTKANATAIGIPLAPQEDTPQAIADFILQYAQGVPLRDVELFSIIEKKHSLSRLISVMGNYMRSGT